MNLVNTIRAIHHLFADAKVGIGCRVFSNRYHIPLRSQPSPLLLTFGQRKNTKHVQQPYYRRP
jgi:hypothetical protein